MSGDGYLIGGDLGSGSCKVTILCTDGRIAGEASVPYSASYPQPGWAEQDPDLWYRAFCGASRAALNEAMIDTRKILALALVGVTHNAVLLDGKGNPLAPSILIFDSRSHHQVRLIKEQWGDRSVRDRTLNDITTQWTWPQLLWIRDEKPELLDSAVNLLFMKDYVRNKLAPSPVTDTIDAGGSLLFDPVNKVWIREFIEDSHLPLEIFPDTVSPLSRVSEICARGSTDSGLPEGLPVIAGTTDTAAEAMGCGANASGRGYIKLASVGRIAVTRDKPLNVPRVLNYSHILHGLWYPGTATKAAASAYRWWRECLDPSQDYSYERMDSESACVEPGSDGIVFLPHILGQWAPLWNDDARGAFIGLHARHGRPHMTRAVLEGVAYSLKDALTELLDSGAVFDSFSLIGGGAVSHLWGQIISDVIEKPIEVPQVLDAALGACLVAAMGIGLIHPDASEVGEWIHIRSRLNPFEKNLPLYRERYERYCDLNESLAS